MHPDYRRFSNEEVDAVVSRILEEVGLAQSYRVSVRSLVRSGAQNWRSCCGASCNPCIGKIEEAVDRTRELLLRSAPKVVEPRESSPAVTAETHEDDTEDRNWGLDFA